ncbi:MAG TPA: class I SAM-dependent methyltransferase [Thermoanaerobaculia bacterium]|nr:class I SAM-dependent methyltransferase [Thermoanaerobaculia bacterium]
MPNVYQYKDFEGSSHRILAALVRRYHNGTSMLDLGAAGGELAAELRPLFRRIIGFELDVDRIGQLRQRLDHVVIADLERVTKLPDQMNVIVLADVLEHIRSQKRLLEMVRASLAPNGLAFISVPNIANATVRLGLLCGVFRYRERGILDETHVRFYTVATIREELENAGFEIVSLHGTSVPIRLILRDAIPEGILRFGEKLLVQITRTWKAFFAYQIVLVARVRAVDAAATR